MISKGQKRKAQEEEDEAASGVGGWERQRQSVLDISLVKYRRCLEQAEPSLRRSVLIANTLRRVTTAATPPETSALRTASPAPPRGSAPSRVPAGHCPASNGAEDATDRHAAGVEDAEDDWVGMTTEPDFSVSAAISSILTELDAAMDAGAGSPACPRPPLRSLGNLPGSGHSGGGDWLADGSKVKGGRPCEVTPWGSADVAEVATSGYLQDVTLDDLFQDIDTSALSSFSSPCPFSQELLRYLPSLASASPSSPFFSPAPCSSSTPFSFSSSPFSPLQGHRELTELEHFMEILVES